MGALCSCTRSDPGAGVMGRSAASFQDITWSSKLNALPYNHGGGFYNTVADDDHKLAAQIWTTTGGSVHKPSDLLRSQTSLAESGIESNAPSMMSATMESHRSATLRAPTTPHAIREKPPPKPPRLQSVNSMSYSSPGSPVSMCPPASPGACSSKSSFCDITGTLDSSFSSHHADVQPISRVYPMGTQDKVYHIVLQTKDFLVNEIDSETLIMPLQDKGVLDPRAVSELLRTTTKTAMGELLLDKLMGKTHREFLYFCDILRHYGKCPHLADLLLALDCLVDLGSEDSVKKRQASNSVEEDSCPMCCTNLGDVDMADDFLTDTTNFDVEILYIDKETGQVKPQKQVANLKQNKLLSAGRINKVPEDLVKHEADRYIPVITCSLYNYCLWDVGMEKISRALSRKSCVRELCLSKCHLGPASIKYLSQSIQQNTGVHKIDLRLNHLSHECLTEFAEGLKKNTSVKVINLSSTELTSESCHVLLQGICRNQSTSDLDIGFNDLTNSGSEVIAQAIATNCPLKRLRIRDNGITFDGAFRLFKALKKNSRLTFLDISSNQIGNRSMTTLSEILRYNRTLKQLNLENCQISEEGCQTLARALKTNTVLHLLNLNMNPISDKGVDGLAEGLKYNQVLDTLCLNMCDITNLGFAKLLDSLQFNMSLKTLKLCYNSICRLCEQCSSISDYNQNKLVVMEDNNDAVNGETSEDKVNGNHETPTVPSIEDVYDKLCQILQQNKDLKVLLWGNKLNEEGSSCLGDHHHSNKYGEVTSVAGDRRSAVSEPADLQTSLLCTPTTHKQYTNISLPGDVILNMSKSSSRNAGNLESLLDNSHRHHHADTNGSAPAHLNQMQREFVQQYTIHGVQPLQNGLDMPHNSQNGHHNHQSATPLGDHASNSPGLLSVVIPNTLNHCHPGHVRPQISPRMGTTAPSVFSPTNKIPPPNLHHHHHTTDFCVSSDFVLHHPRIRTNGSLPRRKQVKPGKVQTGLRNGGVPHVAQCLPEEEEEEGEFKPHTFPRRVSHRTTPV